jgi:DNA-binding transcriptional LysR family regulator
MDRLLSMRAFQHVAEQRGFRAAARMLGLSPPVLTRLIEDLERCLGTRLLNRTTRSVSLTRAGDEFLAGIRPLLAELDEADAAVRAQSSDMSGKLRILSSPAVAVHAVMPAVSRMRRMHPVLAIELHVSHRPEPLIDQFDVTILREDTPLDPEVLVRTIATAQVGLYASAAYVRANGAPRAPEDLSSHRILRLCQRGARVRPLALIDPARPEARALPEAAPALTSNDNDCLVHATLEGLGISAQPALVVAPYVEDGRIQRVLAPWICADSVRVLAAVPSRRLVPRRVNVFLELLAAGAQP